jgi:hypothetical protein
LEGVSEEAVAFSSGSLLAPCLTMKQLIPEVEHREICSLSLSHQDTYEPVSH